MTFLNLRLIFDIIQVLSGVYCFDRICTLKTASRIRFWSALNSESTLRAKNKAQELFAAFTGRQEFAFAA